MSMKEMPHPLFQVNHDSNSHPKQATSYLEPLLLVLLDESLPSSRLFAKKTQTLCEVSFGVVSWVFEEEHVFKHLLRNRCR